MAVINDELYAKLLMLGIIPNETRDHNVGNSNYSQHIIQPWSIWLDWNLNPWDADIVKRVLRTKEGDTRKMDYEKIKHICDERIRQIEAKETCTEEAENVFGNDNFPRQVLCTRAWVVNDGDRLVELFKQDSYYTQPREDLVINDMGERVCVSKIHFEKFFKA